MEQLNFSCAKCGNSKYTVGQIRATGGTLSRTFDVQNQKYLSITCERYTYTEFYKTKTSALSNAFDLFT